jgi:hypothetical protein
LTLWVLQITSPICEVGGCKRIEGVFVVDYWHVHLGMKFI